MEQILTWLSIPFCRAPLSQYTSFKTGGEALIAQPLSLDAFAALLRHCAAQKQPFVVLGRGSNILAPDEGCSALMISTENLQGLRLLPEGRIEAQCGADLKDLSAFSARHSLSGLEFACGIPGSVGGAVYMNAGAYEGEMEQVLESSQIFDMHSNRVETLSAEDHRFCYRSSIFMKRPAFVLSSVFQLKTASSAQIMARISMLTQKREEKQPLEYPSAGSAFKRPEGYFAGKLISDAGLQGVNINGAEVSLKHAGFIINRGGAKSADILALIARVQQEVRIKFGVELQPEVRILNPDGSFRSS